MHAFVDTTHTLNRLSHAIADSLRGLTCFTCYVVHHSHSISHLPARIRHTYNFSRCISNLLDLDIVSLHQLAHALIGHSCRALYFTCDHLHADDQAAQLFNHIVERIGQHAKSVSGDLGLDAQISFTDAAHLTHQFFNLCL